MRTLAPVFVAAALALLPACGPTELKCTTATCDGCCAADDTCQAGTTEAACGTGGKLCIGCPSGQVCRSNACQNPPASCTAANCAGCCDGTGTCFPGTSLEACGSGGATCSPCPSGQACVQNACR